MATHNCSECGITPIPGVRYECKTCDGYNICSSCYKTVNHEISHPMIQYKCPETTYDLSVVRHIRIICDGCGQTPIIGTRNKCSVCRDYDLCDKCNDSDRHDPTHPMIKYRMPQSIPIFRRRDDPNDGRPRIPRPPDGGIHYSLKDRMMDPNCTEE